MSIPILSDIFGDKPETINYKPVDFGASQIKAILENLKAFPEIEKLGSMFQDYMTSAYNKAIPNFSTLLDLGGKTTEQILHAAEPLLHGKIPEDVKAQVLRSGAYKGLMSGGGGQFIQSLQARDLGRTSLDMLTQGANLAGAGASAAQRWAGLASGLIMNPAGFLISPKDQANLDVQQSLIKREIEQQRANIAAAPNPIAKGLSDLVAYLTASYIGRGPAGKPPAAPTYDQGGVANAAALNQGGVAQFSNQYGTTTMGPIEEGAPFSAGGGDFGGGGGGSSFQTDWDIQKSQITPTDPYYYPQENPAVSTSGATNAGMAGVDFGGFGAVGGPTGVTTNLATLLGIGTTYNQFNQP
jgi:hypothetical protein